MGLLFSPPPDSLFIDDTHYPIYTDFRIWLKVLYILSENISAAPHVKSGENTTNHSEVDKLVYIFSLIFKSKRLPRNINTALEAICEFLSPPILSSRCFSRKNSKTEKNFEKEKYDKGNFKNERVFDFDSDFGFIYSAFLEQYGIDLFETNMHFWKFMSLFLSLSKDTALLKIIKIRTTKLSDIKDPAVRTAMRKMKRFYSILPKSESPSCDFFDESDAVSYADISFELDKLF